MLFRLFRLFYVNGTDAMLIEILKIFVMVIGGAVLPEN